MFSFFKKSQPKPDLSNAPADFSFLGVDMHSHLVPGIDDGSPDLETSLAYIRHLANKGYRKLITTPHVHLEFYDNNREKITQHFDQLKRSVRDQQINIALEVAAEYYLDSSFLGSVLPDGLLTFGDNYVLVEVSMAGWPRNFTDIIFTIQSQGYRPVLAHPERYLYETDAQTYLELKKKGVLIQLNLLSVLGYYGKTVKELADRFMGQGIYDFCGSDLHHERHLAGMTKIAREHPEIMQRLYNYNFKNHMLLGGA